MFVASYLGAKRAPRKRAHRMESVQPHGHPRRGAPLGAVDDLAGPLPLVGRTEELTALERMVEDPDRRISTVFVAGEGGVGKSRLIVELAERIGRKGWTVVRGRAYPVEAGVPYALFSDAFLPLMRDLGDEALTVLSRGGLPELRHLFPALSLGRDTTAAAEPGADPEEFRTRLLWNFAEFAAALGSRSPLLILLEDLQWADDSSLQLLHFLARQAPGRPFFVVGTYSTEERDRNSQLVQTERSLLSLHVAELHRLEALRPTQVGELIGRAFEVDQEVVAEFTEFLYGWTRGNPFFVEEVLKTLVTSGRLRRHQGRWLGWEAREIGLPGSVRDAVLARVGARSESARKVAEHAAVIGSRAGYPLLASVTGFDDDTLLGALEELCAHHVLKEQEDGGTVVYDFLHPVVRETLYGQFSLQRARLLHARVAEAMETLWAGNAADHVDELAYHFARAEAGPLALKAAQYLSEAGARALGRHADREAVNYLRAALERLAGAPAGDGAPDRGAVVADLARAHMRLGEYEAAVVLLTDALGSVPAGSPLEARVRRSLGLAHFWSGRHLEALGQMERGLDAASLRGDTTAQVHLRLARAYCLQELGRGGEALTEVEIALPLAEERAEAEMLARVHRTAALLHVWIGPPDKARHHAERAIELATEARNLTVEFWARWGLAVQWGMMGDTEALEPGIAAVQDLADRLRSPVLRLWSMELSIELAYATGDWDAGLQLGEQGIAMARRLNQRALLPRLLVWTSLFYMGRGDLERAEALVAEASEISGLRRGGGSVDVHLVVPGWIGLAHYQVGLGDYQEAMESARRGLEIAEGTGYILWAVHRLLPIYAEACLWAGEIDAAARLGERMRQHATAMDHKLGLAWADACDALVKWKRGDPEGGAVLMRQAAEQLEAIPMVPYAARVRRQLAGRLAEVGDVEGALDELRRVHDVFARLGAELELEKTRIQFREVGHRPPPRGTGEGVAGLTAREWEVARLVAARKSNKAIGKALGISPRTASTHLSNIFQKLDVSSRGELADVIRETGLTD